MPVLGSACSLSPLEFINHSLWAFGKGEGKIFFSRCEAVASNMSLFLQGINRMIVCSPALRYSLSLSLISTPANFISVKGSQCKGIFVFPLL